MNRPILTLPATLLAFILLTTAVSVAQKPAEASRLHRWTSLDWDHVDYPLFVLYGPFDQKPSSAPTKEIGEKKSALDVYQFREVILDGDDKGITIVLNEQDAGVLKRKARKGTQQWFVAVAPPREIVAGKNSISVVKVTAADGQISFRHPECAAVAQSLRYRFRIGEFRLSPR